MANPKTKKKNKTKQSKKRTKNEQKEHSIKLRAYSISTKELKNEALVGVSCQKKNFA